MRRSRSEARGAESSKLRRRRRGQSSSAAQVMWCLGNSLAILGPYRRPHPLTQDVFPFGLPIWWQIQDRIERRIPIGQMTNSNNSARSLVVGMQFATKKLPITINPAYQQNRSTSVEDVDAHVRFLMIVHAHSTPPRAQILPHAADVTTAMGSLKSGRRPYRCRGKHGLPVSSIAAELRDCRHPGPWGKVRRHFHAETPENA